MAQTIKLKRSGTQNAVPSTSQLALGEVALNTYDGKMYIKKSVGGTESIVEIGGAATSSSGLDFTGNLNLADNVHIVIGDGDDLQIYHDGSNSYIDEGGTGDLRIRATNLSLRSKTTNERFLEGIEDGAVTIYHDNATKLATTSTGIDVTGTVTADDVKSDLLGAADGSETAPSIRNIGDSNTGFWFPAADTIGVSTGGVERIRVTSGGYVGIGTASPTQTLTVLVPDNNGIQIESASGEKGYLFFGDDASNTVGRIGYDHATDAMDFWAGSGSIMTVNSTGIDVTGTATVDGLTVDGLAKISAQTNGAYALRVGDAAGSSGSVVGIGKIGINPQNAGAFTYTGTEIRATETASGDYRASLSFHTRASASDVEPLKRLNIANNGNISFYEDTGTTAKFFWDASAERLGLGTISPNRTLHVKGTSTFETTTGNGAMLFLPNDSVNRIYSRAGNASTTPLDLAFNIGSAEAVRITNGGHLLVGKTSQDATNTVGAELKNTGELVATTDGTAAAYFNRKTSDGTVAEFRKNNSVVGTISAATTNIIYGNDTRGIKIEDALIIPRDVDDTTADGQMDLGSATSRFKDLYLSGTISSGAITSTGSTTDDTADALNVKDSSNTQLFRVRNDGVVLIGDNYLYVTSSQGAYFDGAVRFRNGITDDTGQLSFNSSTADITFNSCDLESVGTISSGNITTTGYLRGPSTFTIDPAAHGDDTGTVVIAGNLQVDGTTTTINSTTLTVDDKNITLAGGSANAAAANGAGITVDGASATLTYNSTGDNWAFNKALTVTGSVTSSSDVTADTHFTSSDSNATLSSSGTGGNVYLRPNGKSSPSGQVHIISSGNATFSGSVTATNTILNTGSTTVSAILRGGDGNSKNLVFQKTTGSAQQAKISAVGDDLRFTTGTTTERMRIDSSGNVGIGTTNPNRALHVEATKTTFGDTQSVLQLADDTAMAAGVGGGLIFTGKAITGQTDANTTFAGIHAEKENATSTNTAGALLFSTRTSGAAAPAERMRIDSSGSVGIGTPSPAYPLEVSGAGTISLAYQRTGTGVTAKKWGFHSDNSNTYWQNITDNLLAITVSNTGNVGVGTTAPGHKLHVIGANNTTPFSIDVGASASYNFKANSTSTYTTTFNMDADGLTIGHDSSYREVAFQTAGTNRLVIAAAGAITFNQAFTFPTSDGNPNQVLKTDGSGNVSWATEAAVSANTSISDADGDTKIQVEESSDEDKIRFDTAGSERMIIDATGKVGIGTTSPQSKLDVNLGNNETASIGGTISVGTYAGLRFGYLESGNSNYRHSAIVFERDDAAFGDARGNIHILNSPSGSGSADLGDARLTIVPSGNIGIGTTAPIAKLDVNGSINVKTATTIALSQDTTSTTALLIPRGTAIRSNTDDGYQRSLLSHLGTTGNGAIQIGQQGTAIITDILMYPGSSGNIRFFPSGAEDIRFTAAGKVGIGTTNPGRKLTVQGATGDDLPARFVGGANTTHGSIEFQDPTTTADYKVTLGSKGDALYFQAGGSEKARITSSGNVGIGTTAPSQELHVVGKAYATQGFTTDGAAKSYTWRAINNSSSSGVRYVKICRITATQSSRLSIELNGRSEGYGNGTLPAHGRLVGQLNNDNNYDFTYYDYNTGSSEVVTEIGQVDVDTASTDIYVKISDFAEIAAVGVISDGDIYPTTGNTGASQGVASAPTGYTAIIAQKIIMENTSGNVGIGTDAPLQALHVNSGTGNSAAIFESTDSTSQIWLKDSASSSTYQTGIACFGDNLLFNNGGEKMRIDSSGTVVFKGGTTDNALQIWENNSEIARIGGSSGTLNFLVGSTTASRMAIDSSGLVGIGTSSPTSSYGKALHIHNTGTGSALHLTDGTSGSGATDGTDFLHYGNDSYIINRESSGALRFFTAGSEAARISSDGNIDVAGGSLILRNGALASPTTGALKDAFFSNVNGTMTYAVNGASNAVYGQHAFTVRKGDSSDPIEAIRINSSGNVGIGTNSPQSKLHLLQTGETYDDGIKLVGTSGSISGRLYMSGEHLRIDNATAGSGSGFTLDDTGKIGINEINPSYKLEVAGDGHLIRATGTTAGGSARIGVYNENDGAGHGGAVVYLQSSGWGEGFLNIGSHKIGAESGDFNIRAGNGLDLTFGNGTAEYARITGTGNFGIGTTNPTNTDYGSLNPKLHVKQSGTTGAFNLVARFEAGSDAEATGGAILINHSNDRGMLIEGGRDGSGSAADDDAVGHLGIVTSSGAHARMITLRQNMVGASGVYNVGIGTTAPQAKLQIEDVGIDTNSTTTSATTQVAIDTMAAATFRSARYTIQVTNSTDSTYHLTEMLLIHDGTDPSISEFGTIFTGSAAEAVFTADISSGNVRLLATPASADAMAFKVIRHSILV